jgi:hypothetical protein
MIKIIKQKTNGKNIMSVEKYELETIDEKDIIALADKPCYRNRRMQEIIVNGKEGFWKGNVGTGKGELKTTSAAHYGELIAFLLYSKAGLDVCKVKICKRNMLVSGSKTERVEVPGCISYVDLKENENLLDAKSILSYYKYDHYDEYFAIVKELEQYQNGDCNISEENVRDNDNIELIIPAFETFCKENCKVSSEQLVEIRQKIIDMIVADCKFSNPDRNGGNYGLGISKKETRFYPLFDNEDILGFVKYTENIDLKSEDNDTKLSMYVNSEYSECDNDYRSIMKYLFKIYPEETNKSYEKVMKITEEDLDNIMKACEGLDDTHKDYAKRIFNSRDIEFKNIKEEYENESNIQSRISGNQEEWRE